MKWLRRLYWRAVDALDRVFDPPCPHGPWRSSTCFGCTLDRMGAGSPLDMHAADSVEPAPR